MIDWSAIDKVFLDLDGTLLDLHFDNHFWLAYVPQRYAQKHGLAEQDSHNILDKKYRAAMGSLNWYCTDYWSQQLELNIAELKKEVQHKIAVRPQVEEFLEFLHMMGKRVVLVTNAHPASVEIKMNKTGLQTHFDCIITAHELGHAKEQTAFWPALQAVESFDDQRTLFIDDNFDVLDAAQAYGLKHLLAIKKPDSQGDDKQHQQYRLLDSFSQIM